MTEYDWAIRQSKESDIPFIYSSWLESYASTWDIKKSTFMKEYKYVIDEILLEGCASVACKKDEPDVVFGYMVYSLDFPTVHYAYVKENFRKHGIAKSLFDGSGLYLPITITHRTDLAKKILPSNIIYNPFLLFKRGDSHDAT